MRKTLDQRLTPAVAESFRREAQQHPQMIEQIMYDLSNCLFWQDMTVKTMRSVYLFSDVDPHHEDYMKYYWGDEELFDKEDNLI